MQIAAIDADTLANGSGNAHITWISKQPLATSHAMHSSSTSYIDWHSTTMYSYLQNTIKPKIPSNVRSSIVNVSKFTYYYATTAGDRSTRAYTDDVWIPSAREVGFGYENQGVVYSTLFNSNTARIKTKTNATSASKWWLRSVVAKGYSNGHVCVLETGNSGGITDAYSQYSYGVALGFCM